MRCGDLRLRGHLLPNDYARTTINKTKGCVRDAALACNLFPNRLLRKNDHLSFHTQDIVQGADIRIDTWLAESDAEASYSRRCLREPGAILGSRLDESRVHTVGRRVKHTVRCAVGVDRYIRGRRSRIPRFGAEGDCVRCDWIFIGPLHRVACMNRNHRILETHHRDAVGATPCGYDLAVSDRHAISRMLVLQCASIFICQQGCALLLSHTI